MATDKVYQYLTAFLAGEMRKSYPKFDVGLGYGAKDSKPTKQWPHSQTAKGCCMKRE